MKWASLPLYIKVSVAAICFVFSILTFLRTSDWKDKITLYRSDIRHLPNSAQAHNLLALQIMNTFAQSGSPAADDRLPKEAVEHFRRSIEIYSGFFNTNYDLARAYLALNQADSAVFWFKKSTLLNPAFTDAYVNIGDILFQLNRFPEAILYLDTAIRLNPTDYFPCNRLSFIYFKESKFAESIDINKLAAKNILTQPEPSLNVAKTYQAMLKYDSARIWYQKTLQVSPGNAEAAQLLQALPVK